VNDSFHPCLARRVFLFNHRSHSICGTHIFSFPYFTLLGKYLLPSPFFFFDESSLPYVFFFLPRFPSSIFCSAMLALFSFFPTSTARYFFLLFPPSNPAEYLSLSQIAHAHGNSGRRFGSFPDLTSSPSPSRCDFLFNKLFLLSFFSPSVMFLLGVTPLIRSFQHISFFLFLPRVDRPGAFSERPPPEFERDLRVFSFSCRLTQIFD